jgi:hypothetical protein
VQATDHPDLRAVLRFVDLNVPRDAVVAIQPSAFPARTPVRGELLAFPFFGRDLTRRVFLADSLERATAVQAEWAILRTEAGGPCWRRVFRFDPWTIFRRRCA